MLAQSDSQSRLASWQNTRDFARPFWEWIQGGEILTITNVLPLLRLSLSFVGAQENPNSKSLPWRLEVFSARDTYLEVFYHLRGLHGDDVNFWIRKVVADQTKAFRRGWSFAQE